ncbi:hypothetical protein [Dysgonomonas capnocytophagoides]|uniref:hypothetical protein n=1 Tax=Dysgonomonas capnocytophagoides TaxID=45254 RepID=UPI003994518A
MKKELFDGDSFNLESAIYHWDSIKEEYAELENCNFHKPRRENLRRIIERSEEIENKICT